MGAGAGVFHLTGARRDAGKQEHQTVGINRFGDVFVSTSLEGRLPVLLEMAAGDDHDFRMPQVIVAPQRAADLEAVAAGHEQVGEDDIRPVHLCQLDARVAVLGLDHLPVPLPQQVAHEFAVIRVVVNDQDCVHGP